MSEQHSSVESVLSVFLAMFMTWVITVLAVLPIIVAVQVGMVLEWQFSDLPMFIVLFVGIAWQLWVLVLFSFPTTFVLVNRANAILKGEAELGVKEGLRIVRRGLLKATPFYLPEPESH